MNSSTKRDSLHAGMRVHPNYNSYIPATAANDQSSNYDSQSSSYTDKQQHQQSQGPNQPRKRTRATPEQLSVLEKTFSVNPSPNNRVREQLSKELGMSERSIQIWFQNRRAKVKNMAKRSSVLHDETMRMQYYAATAAAAACQAANSQQQQHTSPDGTPVSNTDLYYYYYYYYYNQQQQHQQQQQQQQQQSYYGADTPPPVSLKSSTQPTPPPPPPPPMPSTTQSKPWASLSTPPPSSISPSSSTPISMYHHHQQQQSLGATTTSSSPSNTSFTSSVHDAAGGRIRSHSVGHYPYNPYQRSRPGSSEPVSGYPSRRHYSTSASPAPPSLHPIWPSLPQSSSSSQPSTLGPHSMIPEEELSAVNSYDPTAWSSGEQDERFGTPMSMVDEFTTTGDDDNESNQYRISVEALQIGTWKRMSLQPHDLECFYDRHLRCMVWRIQDGLQRFKMHIKVESIEKVQLDPLLERLGWARLSLTVIQPETICFYMEEGAGPGYAGAGGESWTQCRDFTQDRQATSVHLHYIDGPALALRAEWMRLVAHDQHLQDLFQNNMVQPCQQQQQQQHPYPYVQQVMNPNQLYHTARGPHGQSMLSNSTPSREVTPADVMMVLQNDGQQQSMLSLMEKDQDKDQDAQDLLLFQGL